MHLCCWQFHSAKLCCDLTLEMYLQRSRERYSVGVCVCWWPSEVLPLCNGFGLGDHFKSACHVVWPTSHPVPQHWPPLTPKTSNTPNSSPAWALKSFQTHIVFEVVEVQEDCLYDVCGTGVYKCLFYESSGFIALSLSLSISTQSSLT